MEAEEVANVNCLDSDNNNKSNIINVDDIPEIGNSRAQRHASQEFDFGSDSDGNPASWWDKEAEAEIKRQDKARKIRQELILCLKHVPK